MARELNVDLVAADRKIWSGSATMVVAKTAEGEIGLLSGHEPMLAIMVPGQIRISLAEGQPVVAETTQGGFLSIESDTVTLVVRDATLVS
ncbi:F0F1 ATP synthase subunit epsilon [Aquiluna borgnonia]|uniref:F0F1 ATP synthase subunit epsilon n=1 Tax=Aquiluna borgnonia TaxID=2499157 RepID=A0A7D4TUE9_9MICO|nr:F0F1 ATP synthase subunit epsilon [Aquiluna borgnonia]QKJ25495.1 F0F1 ATP synthase subunit epsilon [Aquiluna borgnonia]